MKFSHVRAFKAVYELGTVTGAANYLHVTQPAVSHLIAALEDDLGFKLFDRVKGRLQPTDDGRSFYTEVDKLFLGLESLTKIGRAIRDQGTEGLVIAAMPLLSDHFIALVIQQFRRTPDGPGPLQVKTFRSDEVANRVAMQTCDLGFSLEPSRSADVQCVHLVCDNICLVPKAMWRWGRSRSLSLEQIAELPLIRHERDLAQDALDGLLAHPAESVGGSLEVSFASTVAALVALGEGAAVVDPFTAHTAIQLNRSVVTAEIKPPLPFILYLLLPRRRLLSNRAAAFLRTFDVVCRQLRVELTVHLPGSDGAAAGPDLTITDVIERIGRNGRP